MKLRLGAAAAVTGAVLAAGGRVLRCRAAPADAERRPLHRSEVVRYITLHKPYYITITITTGGTARLWFLLPVYEQKKHTETESRPGVWFFKRT
jgi:hypothetical protein